MGLPNNRGFFFSGTAALLLLGCGVDVQQSRAQQSSEESGARITGTKSPWGTPASANDTSSLADPSRMVFVNGNVLFDDGSSFESASVRIERVCGSRVRVETHTDSQGRFSIRLGGDVTSNIAAADSSDNSFGTAHSATDSASGSEAALSGEGSPGLMHCELRAAYPGYVSESVALSTDRSSGSQNVGTLVLHHLANVRGTTVSVTTALAPKSAQKKFKKGYEFWKRGKFEEAEEMFRAATAEDAKFAIAWVALGDVERRLNQFDETEKAYLKAIAADSHYVSPYNQLARLKCEAGKWQEAAHYSQEAIDLNPVELPSSFWYSALANYNLEHRAEAEKSAQALVKLGAQHHFPLAETMLAEFAVDRQDWHEAAAYLRAFLADAPKAENAPQVQRQLARVEAAEAKMQAKTETSARPSAQPAKTGEAK